jgi:hypothetical protein
MKILHIDTSDTCGSAILTAYRLHKKFTFQAIDPSMLSIQSGALFDYTDETKEAVHSTGFSGACTNNPGFVHHRTDLFRIPRVLAHNWKKEVSVKHIGRHFAG